MNVQPRYSWELINQELDEERQRQKQAIENFYRAYGDQRPGIPGKTLLAAFAGVLVTGVVAYAFIYLLFSLPFGK